MTEWRRLSGIYRSALKQIPLAPHDLGEIEAMVFDPIGFGLWLGGNKALGHFQSNGVFIARIPVSDELQALAATPFRLRPTLSLLAPTDGIITNNAYTPLPKPRQYRQPLPLPLGPRLKAPNR